MEAAAAGEWAAVLAATDQVRAALVICQHMTDRCMLSSQLVRPHHQKLVVRSCQYYRPCTTTIDTALGHPV